MISRLLLSLIAFCMMSSTYAVPTDLKARLKNFRDPFKKNIGKLGGRGGKKKKTKTFFSNKFDVSSIFVEEIKIIGIYLGKERRAIGIQAGKVRNAKPFIIREGMKLGPDGIEVKAILPGGIVLVEKITNVYDEVEYLETIIPVSDD